MPCPHNEISIVQRSQQQSAIAAAAYQSGDVSAGSAQPIWVGKKHPI